MYLRGHIAIAANVQHPTFHVDLNNLRIIEFKKKCDLTRNDGLPFGWEISGRIIRGRNSKTNGSKSECLPERKFSPRSKRLSRREWKEARQTAKQLVNLVWELSTSVSILRCCFYGVSGKSAWHEDVYDFSSLNMFATTILRCHLS